MSDEVTESADKPKAKKAPTTGKYKNTSGYVNVFTSKGRVMPGQTVMMSVKEAEQYAALEKC